MCRWQTWPMQCREIYNLIFTSADWRCQREKWIIWGMEKCHWRAFFSVVQRRWSKTSKEATWTYEFEHQPTAHTHIFTAVHIFDPKLLTTITHLYHMHSAHSTICFTKMFARGTSMRDRCLQAEFPSQGPQPTRSSKFMPLFFIPKILENLAFSHTVLF